MTPVGGTDYAADFERFRAALPSDPPFLAALRRVAMERFSSAGFPTTREESWRYTNVAPIVQGAFRPAPRTPLGTEAGSLGALGLELAPGPGVRAVFVNGAFRSELSALGGADGAEVRSLADVLSREPERLEGSLDRLGGPAGNAFSALNTAFLEDGAFVSIPEGLLVRDPIHLVFFSTSPPGGATLSFPRALILAGRGSQATVVQTFAGRDGEVYLTSAVTEVRAGEGAVLDHYSVQGESTAAFHVAALSVRQERDSRLSSRAFSLGAALARHDIDVLLDAPGCECALDGLFLAGGEQHTDTRTRIVHAKPHGTSRELYKGILDGRSRGVFTGTIVVEKDAQKTDAHQTNKNLLLSREALVHTTPQLQILADDVKCKHGSTTGQLDAEGLFYLRSRGISEAAARSLLTLAFAGEVIRRVAPAELRAALRRRIVSRLPGAQEIHEAVA